jgi:hypothetical protein
MRSCLGSHEGTHWPKPQRTLPSRQRVAARLADACREIRRARKQSPSRQGIAAQLADACQEIRQSRRQSVVTSNERRARGPSQEATRQLGTSGAAVSLPPSSLNLCKNKNGPDRKKAPGPIRVRAVANLGPRQAKKGLRRPFRTGVLSVGSAISHQGRKNRWRWLNI